MPALITAGAAVLADLILRYGAGPPVASGDTWWRTSGDVSAARDLRPGRMSETSHIVVVTFVILTLAVYQLGPRLSSTSMGDRQIRSVLRLFLGTNLLVVIVIRAPDDKLGSKGVPQVAVTAASLLTIACLFALLCDTHRIARSIISGNGVDAAARNSKDRLTGATRIDARIGTMPPPSSI